MAADWEQWVKVGRAVCGRGVFAAREIPAGTHVGRVQGKVIDDPNYTSAYCIDLGGDRSLEPLGPFRFLNHCCEPNATLSLYDCEYEDGSPAPAEVYVEALRTIRPDEEVRIDYAWSLDGAIPCLCNSPNCRGWVVDAAELPKLLKKLKKSAPAPAAPTAPTSPPLVKRPTRKKRMAR